MRSHGRFSRVRSNAWLGLTAAAMRVIVLPVLTMVWTGLVGLRLRLSTLGVIPELAEFLRAAAGFGELRGPLNGGVARREFQDAEEMLNRMFRTVREMKPSDIASTFPYYYGYQITVGPDGGPRVREFGYVRPSARGLIEQTGVREPLIDTKLEEKDNTLTITAEMPGVTKQDIKVSVGEDHVAINAQNTEKKYQTTVPVNVQLDDNSAKATYANGILELKIKLKEPAKPRSKEVKVD